MEKACFRIPSICHRRKDFRMNAKIVLLVGKIVYFGGKNTVVWRNIELNIMRVEKL